MTAEEIINGDGELTPEALGKLKLADLRKVATDLFEIEGVEKFKKDELLYKMKEMLAEFQFAEDRKTIESFVRNMDNQERAVQTALNIRNAFDRNWFEPSQLATAYRRAMTSNIAKIEDKEEKIKAEREFHDNPPTAESVTGELATLSLFGLVKKKTFGQGKKSRTKYKIVMTVVVRALERKKKEEEAKEANEQTAEEVTAG